MFDLADLSTYPRHASDPEKERKIKAMPRMLFNKLLLHTYPDDGIGWIIIPSESKDIKHRK